ncbi:MAG: hypothetical protein U1E23_04745 [Reyranellaceae bacterium]
MRTRRRRGRTALNVSDLLAGVRETVYAGGVHFRRARDGESLGHRLMARARRR